MTKQYKVVIQWGLTTLPDSEVKSYYFDTEKEMESFLDGVHEANGWLEYAIIEEGRNVDR
jgi:hypothetical protein